MVPANSYRISRVPHYSGYHYPLYAITTTRLSRSIAKLSNLFVFLVHEMSWSYYPIYAETYMVWANPSSLAATMGITIVFFSYAYLDVSVQRVCPSCEVINLQLIGLPHSDIYGSTLVCNSP